MWTKLILAIVPSIVFGVFTIIFTVQQDAFSVVARDQDQRLAAEQRKQNIFDNCVDVVSEILLSPNFNRSNIDHLQPIQVKVITALRRLDSSHKRDIIFYLYANKLIRNDLPPEFRLDLRGADLNGVEFVKSGKGSCILNDIFLSGILASNIVFSGCELDRSNFEGSIMVQSQFYNCSLGFAKLSDVNLEYAVFQGNMFWRTIFAGSSLLRSSFAHSTLFFVDFTNTDIFGSNITTDQLFGVHSTNITTNIVRNLRLPNGSVMMQSSQLVKDGGAEQEVKEKRKKE